MIAIIIITIILWLVLLVVFIKHRIKINKEKLPIRKSLEEYKSRNGADEWYLSRKEWLDAL